MAYEKQTWKNGDIITEQKLNHIEDGIAAVGSSGGGGGVDYVLFIHDYKTGNLDYISSIPLDQIDGTTRIDFFITEAAEGDPIWGSASPCTLVSAYATGGNVCTVQISPNTSTMLVKGVSWEIVHGEVTNLSYSDAFYSMYQQT